MSLPLQEEAARRQAELQRRIAEAEESARRVKEEARKTRAHPSPRHQHQSTTITSPSLLHHHTTPRDPPTVHFSEPPVLHPQFSSTHLQSKYDSTLRSPSMLQLGLDTSPPSPAHKQRDAERRGGESRIPVRRDSTIKRSKVMNVPKRTNPPNRKIDKRTSPPLPTHAKRHPSTSPPVPALAKKRMMVSSEEAMTGSVSPPIPTVARRLQERGGVSPRDSGDVLPRRSLSPPVPALAKKLQLAGTSVEERLPTGMPSLDEAHSLPINRPPSCAPITTPLEGHTVTPPPIHQVNTLTPAHLHLPPLATEAPSSSHLPVNGYVNRQHRILEELAMLRQVRPLLKQIIVRLRI